MRAPVDSAARPKTVLIVDDMPDNLGVLTTHLEDHGYLAVVAQGGAEGIERAEFVHPDLILLDVLMPGLDGLETCRRLKASERTRDIPIIFMTALVDTVAKVAGFEAGAVDYVTKPLDGAEVLARIDTHLTLYRLRHELELQNAQLQREILAHEQTQQALRRSNTELEQLAYVASHDMQEPLRMVASYLQLVAQRYQGRLDADADEFIGYAVDGAKRMQALINDLLAYSRIGTKARPFEPTDCNAVVKTALAQLRIAIDESGAEVAVGALPTVPGDATQLLQLFQNLIGNAIKFRGGGRPPKVDVSAEPHADGWCFAVRDNGIGIAPEYFERVFVLFQRLHGRTEYAGTGIGLAICKKIVERHGGRIWVESTPGEGAVFRFTTPREQAQDKR
jgi:two-component system sensor histidine kinase/response regulator